MYPWRLRPRLGKGVARVVLCMVLCLRMRKTKLMKDLVQKGMKDLVQTVRNTWLLTTNG